MPFLMGVHSSYMDVRATSSVNWSSLVFYVMSKFGRLGGLDRKALAFLTLFCIKKRERKC